MSTVRQSKSSTAVATLLGATFVILNAATTFSQQSAPTNDAESVSPQVAEKKLQFSFERQPWRGVLDWLAAEADLALHVGDLPTGSFTYDDSRQYTPDEAINRINLFLIPQRYALVRSGKLLSVVNLDDSSSVRQLDAMAESVDTETLNELGSHDLVKCLFSLGSITPEQALEELNGLMLIREPVVLRNTNQLLVTDIVAKQLMVQKILAGLGDPDAILGPVRYFPIGELDGEKVLAQVRPHVGLDPLAMTGSDISLSIDIDGRQILASGSQDNLDAVASVIKTLQDKRDALPPLKQVDFRTHAVGEADMQTVVSVLQTLLADEDVRMAPDQKSNQLAILGEERVHKLVEGTIADLAKNANKVEFKAINVPVDPRYAAMVLNGMFAPAEVERADGSSVPTTDAPRISADPFSGRIFVRGKSSQIAEIERAAEQLTQSSDVQSPNLRMLPFRGERARQLLNSAKDFWPHDDQLQILPSTDGHSPQPIEREVNPTPVTPTPPVKLRNSSSPKVKPRQTDDSDVAMTLVHAKFKQPPSADTSNADLPNAVPKIRIQQTPQGIIVHSDDPTAITRFEQHMQMIAGPDEETQRLAIFYLKHASSDEANQLLQRMLDAEEFATPVSQAMAGGGLMGGFVDVIGAGNVGRIWSFGTATIIPDKRLNRLFVYGTAADLTKIEEHLSVIDREDSIAQVATHGTPRVVQLKYAKAEAVADVIRDAYAGRIADNTQQRQAALQAQRQPQNQQGRQQQSGNQNAQPQNTARNSQPNTSEQPKLTLAADAQSNTLVITAPEQLAAEVEALALRLDQEGEQATHIISLRASSPSHVQETLRLLLEANRQGSSRSPQSQSGGNNSRAR